jgi:hypothetical protein
MGSQIFRSRKTAPYFYAYWKDNNGELRKKYIGKNCPPPFPVPTNVTEIYIPNGDRIYTLEYVVLDNNPGLLSDIQKMIDSFEIMNSAEHIGGKVH